MSSRTLSCAALIALALAACGGPDYGISYGGGDGPAVDPDIATQGQALYSRLCAECHGADASGGPRYGGSIRGAQGIADIVRVGTRGMPGNDLSDAQIDALEAYLAVRAGAPLADGSGSALPPEVGGAPPAPSGGTTSPPADNGGAQPSSGGSPAPAPGGGDDDGDSDEGFDED